MLLSYDILDKIQKRVVRNIGPTLAASLESLDQHRNVARLRLFYRYYFGRCLSELPVSILYSLGSTRYFERLRDFCVTISRCYKNVYFNSVFSRTARLWHFLAA